MFNLLKSFLNWFTGKNDTEQLEKLKEAIPEEPLRAPEPPPPIRKGSLEDIRDYCDEMRKDLTIRKRLDERQKEIDDLRKKTDDRLYVEVGNLKSKIERFIEGQK